jgi:hypothetical protein
MNKFIKFITWAVAATNIVFITLYLSALMHFGDSYPGGLGAKPHAHWIHVLQAATIATIGQLGLILSPLVVSRHLLLRSLIVAMMIPFIYFVVIGEAIVAIRSLFSPTLTWKYNLTGSVNSFLFASVWVLTYGYNIFALLRKQKLPEVRLP